MLALPAAMLFPALWAMAPSRGIAAFVSLGYFLAASRGLPQGVANFYAADLWPGLLLWLIASASFVIVHAVLWTRRRGKVRAARYLVASLVMALPPFGITGWAQPITAAGVLFPGWGWWGLAATAAGLAMMTSRTRSVLERVRDAIDRNDLPAALGFAISNREAKLEIDGFNKAVSERFGERALLSNSAQAPDGPLFDKMASGLQPAEKESLKEAWPVMRTAQQLAAHERTTATLKQVEDIRLSQRQTPSLKP